MKILVIQQKMIGDVLASSIICRNLKLFYPTARIDYMVYRFTAPVVGNNPGIDRLIIFEDHFRKSKKDFLEFLISVRNTKYDIVIDAYGKLESNLVVGISGAKTRIGFYKPYTSFLYTKTFREMSTPETGAGLAIENRLQLLSPFGQPSIVDPEIFLTGGEIASGRTILLSGGVDISERMVMVGILGSGPEKSYPAKYMAEVIEAIALANVQILLNYAPAQKREASEILERCSAKARAMVYSEITTEGIRDFLSVMYHCSAFIGNEGGAANMAKALNKPVFAIFSPWIKKEAWNSKEDGVRTVSIHLRDFEPSLYGRGHEKKLRARSSGLYERFVPQMFTAKLVDFIARL